MAALVAARRATPPPLPSFLPRLPHHARCSKMGCIISFKDLYQVECNLDLVTLNLMTTCDSESRKNRGCLSLISNMENQLSAIAAVL
jgi:hypothetical protein